MAKWPYSLSMLPVGGIMDPTANLSLVRGRLLNTLEILDGVLKVPSGLPERLRQAVYNVRFHVVVGIDLIDGFVTVGHSFLEPAASVDGLYEAIDAHVEELRVTAPIWQAWMRGAWQDFGGDRLPAPLASSWFRQAAQPVGTRDYIGAGLATAGLYGATRAFGGTPRPFHGFGDVPDDADVQAAQAALDEMLASQTQMKNVFNALVSSCGSLDSSLQRLVVDSDDNYDYVRGLFQAFLAGEIEIATLTDAVNGRMLANDAFVQKMNTNGCDTAVLANGTLGNRNAAGAAGGGSTGAAGGGSGGSGSGSGSGAVIKWPTVSQAGVLGTGSWIALVGGALFALYLYRQKTKGKAKKTTRRRAPKRRVVKRRRRRR